MVEVPLTSDPVPQVLLIGNPVAVNPVKTLVKLSVNSILLAEKLRSKFVIVNSRSTVVPGLTGSSRKLFCINNCGVSVTSKVAAANPKFTGWKKLFLRTTFSVRLFKFPA